MLYLRSTDEAIWPGSDLDCFTRKKRSFAATVIKVKGKKVRLDRRGLPGFALSDHSIDNDQ